MNAARLVNQQELSGLMEGLNEETISSLMDDPEMLTYLGKMNEKGFFYFRTRPHQNDSRMCRK